MRLLGLPQGQHPAAPALPQKPPTTSRGRIGRRTSLAQRSTLHPGERVTSIRRAIRAAAPPYGVIRTSPGMRQSLHSVDIQRGTLMTSFSCRAARNVVREG